MNQFTLPNGYTARPARHDDAQDVAALQTACRAAVGEAPVTPEDLLDDWDELDDLADGAVVVFAPDGRLVAEADVLNHRFVRVSVYGYVHQQGLGLALLHHAFGEFYRRGIRRVELSVDAESPTGAPRLYTRAGMHVAQSYGIYRREIRPGRDFNAALT